MSKQRLIAAGLILGLVVLVGVGIWQTSGHRGRRRVAVVRECQGVMGTSCRLATIVRPGREADAEEPLRRAEAVLHAVESRMSTWLAKSEISQLNAAAADRPVPLSPETLDVLRTAQAAHVQTGGVFDVTCRPLIELWRAARDRELPPSDAELSEARAASNWELVRLEDGCAVKRAGTARVDLGGIAKGHAIDRAANLLEQAGLAGGMVDVGGDLVCFGKPPVGESWTVDIQDPFGDGVLATLHLPSGAVCTSGSYARFGEIGGKRISHIIDPRSCRPIDGVASVTVIGPDAVTADIWATALSILGPDGFSRIPDGLEAMIVTGGQDDYQVHQTPGFGAKEIRDSGIGLAPAADVEVQYR